VIQLKSLHDMRVSTGHDPCHQLQPGGNHASVQGTFLKHHAVKTYLEMQVQIHVFLTSVLDGGEWSASCPSCFIPWRIPGTHMTGGWVGPRPSLNEVVKRKTYHPTSNCKLVVQNG